MIQFEHLTIHNFRGIRVLDLPLNGESFVVHGPNGSGKSGVIDAIDFALTGSVSRLSGGGMGDVSLLRHGPHVHNRENPESAKVKLKVRDLDSGKSATLTRAVKNAKTFTLEPDLEEVRASLQEAQAHPELTLSRREIINYIATRPAQRSDQVQALLKLKRLDDYRRTLLQAKNKAIKEHEAAVTAVNKAKQNLASHVGQHEHSPEILLRAINKKRTTLDLPPFAEIDLDSNLAAGIQDRPSESEINIASAKREVSDLQKRLKAQEELGTAQEVLSEKIKEITKDSQILDSVRHRELVKMGLNLARDSHCPLCDHEWESYESLKEHLESKIANAQRADELQRSLTEASKSYGDLVRDLKRAVELVIPYIRKYGSLDAHHRLKDFEEELLSHTASVGSNTETLLQAGELLTSAAYSPPAALEDDVTKLADSLENEPDQSSIIEASTFLTTANERWASFRVSTFSEDKAQTVKEVASTLYEQYCTTVDTALETLYRSVEKDFSDYYRFINSDDEGDFSADLTPSTGSLELAVDFYGIGKFPPTAYHSEGHQDGMGVCLYLALVKQLLGEKFRYSVLDDVVMSVDVNHRKQFCRLLKSEFPNVQFIITTHDAVWARQMQSEGLINSRSQARFYGWSVDGGPLYEQGGIWDRIEEDLRKEDVAGAAHKLRHRLEAACGDIAHNIGAEVPYRGDNSYDLGVLLSAVKGRHKALLSMASKSADKWKNSSAMQDVRDKKEVRARVLSEQEQEQWIVNKLVHNNDWVTSSVTDFTPILEASRDFLDLFTCQNENCTGWVRVIGFPPENLKCNCGSYNLNLKHR